jgi:hypothetical protein
MRPMPHRYTNGGFHLPDNYPALFDALSQWDMPLVEDMHTIARTRFRLDCACTAGDVYCGETRFGDLDVTVWGCGCCGRWTCWTRPHTLHTLLASPVW